MARHRTWLALAFVVAGFGITAVDAAITGTTSLHYPSTPSGKVDTRYHDGNDGTPAAPLTWAVIEPISVLTSATGSVDVCQNYLTQPAAPGNTADITVASGFSLPTGFSLGSTHNCVLSWTTPSAASVQVRLTATLAGVIPATSLAFSITVTAAPSADTTAPPVPVGLSCTDATGQSNCAIDSVADNYESDGDAPTGTSSYKVYLDGVLNQTLTVANPTKAPQFTASTIGSPVSPSSSQSGNDFTLTSGGDIDGTDGDNTRVFSAPVSTDFVLSWKLASVTNNGATVAKYGGQVRNSLVATSRYVSGHNQLGTTSQCRRRTTDGGNTGGEASVAEALPRASRITRVSSAISYETSADTNTFSALCNGYSGTTFDSSVYAALFDVGDATHASTVTLTNVNLSSAGRLSFTITTTGSHAVSVAACDGVPNCSVQGASVAINPSSPADVTAPAAPTSQSCASGGQTQINCTATAPTDPSGIRGYIWSFAPTSGGTYVDQTEQALIAFTLGGLTASTQRCGKVKAIDNAGNVGAFSSFSCATTASSGTDPTVAPTISFFDQNTDRSASYSLVHSSVANAHHYIVQMADCPDGQTPGVPATLSTHTTASATLAGFAISDAKSIRVGASNAAETVVFFSSATTCKTIFDPWSTTFNFNPGFYIEIGNKDDTAAKRTEHRAYINLPAPWKGIERSQTTLYMLEHSLGDYSAGVNFMDAYLGDTATAGKHLWIELEDKTYGNHNGVMFGNYYPAYLNSATYSGGVVLCALGGQACSGTLSSMATTWDPDTADRYIAVGQWMCGAYGNNPRFEGLSWGGFSISPAEIPGFTMSGYIAQVKRIMAAWRQACPKQQLAMRVDYTGTQQAAHDLAKWARGYRINFSDYDIYDWAGRTGSVTPGTSSNKPNNGQQAFRGVQIIGGVGQPNSPGISGVDLRAKQGYFGHIEGPDWTRAGSGMWGQQSFNEFLEIAQQLGSTSLAIYPYNSTVTPTGFTPLGNVIYGNPASDVVRRCVENGTGTGCTPAIRDAASSTTRPTDWIP